jgi:hypothetical protein
VKGSVAVFSVNLPADENSSLSNPAATDLMRDIVPGVRNDPGTGLAAFDWYL